MHTLVLGASTNPSRVSYQAIQRLVHNGFQVSAVGLRTGTVAGVAIQQGLPVLDQVHTITLYLNPQRQNPLYEYVLGLQPKRIIFNPGTENAELAHLAKAAEIEVVYACTLVMLATGDYAEV
ncbi:MAG: CoA-binding protein [Bacteroidetes bacterium]|nr:MAG: CoA-binding protein [Bacteroidota bacterium]